jgi:hypothetical protein
MIDPAAFLALGPRLTLRDMVALTGLSRETVRTLTTPEGRPPRSAPYLALLTALGFRSEVARRPLTPASGPSLLRTARKASQVTQRRLATLSGLPLAQVTRYEQGLRTSPPVADLAALFEATGYPWAVTCPLGLYFAKRDGFRLHT